MRYVLDSLLPGGMNENNSYFDDGEEMFDDGVRLHEVEEKPERDPAEVRRLLDEIESQIPEDVIELFEGKKRKKEVA